MPGKVFFVLQQHFSGHSEIDDRFMLQEVLEILQHLANIYKKVEFLSKGRLSFSS